MKKNPFISILALTLIFVSCQGSENETVLENNEVKIAIDSLDSEPEMEEEELNLPDNNNSVAWNSFKTAVNDQDIPGISSFATSDEIDSEELLMFLSDSTVMSILLSTDFDELTVVNQSGEEYLEFSAQETSIDEDGHEVSMAIFLYFTEKDDDFKLDYYIVAG